MTNYGVCDICLRDFLQEELSSCSVCEIDGMCGSCREAHNTIVKKHAVLCHIAIDNTSPGFAGVLCRTCGKEARCDH